jgi:acid phosphatase (class A)
MGVVLASLLPAKSQAILARASQYAEHRLVCGVHFRSDIAAGQQFGTVLALKLMDNPRFARQMKAARAELHAAHL